MAWWNSFLKPWTWLVVFSPQVTFQATETQLTSEFYPIIWILGWRSVPKVLVSASLSHSWTGQVWVYWPSQHNTKYTCLLWPVLVGKESCLTLPSTVWFANYIVYFSHFLYTSLDTFLNDSLFQCFGKKYIMCSAFLWLNSFLFVKLWD